MNRKPFIETFEKLLREREWSLRELSRRIEKDQGEGRGLHHVSISLLARGVNPPSSRAMEKIAKAMRIDPRTFPEYRLDLKRAELDWRKRGLTRALKALDE